MSPGSPFNLAYLYSLGQGSSSSSFFFSSFFERASLIFIAQMVVNSNKIQFRGVNAQCTFINPSQA